MYEFDSFFTLTQWERVGLVALSCVMAAACLCGLWLVARGRVWAVRVVVAVLVFWAFVWMSPQAYYAYYRVIFEDLPPRWVIPQAPSVAELWGHLSFTGRSTLSSHGKGVLGWCLLAVGLLAPHLRMGRGRR